MAKICIYTNRADSVIFNTISSYVQENAIGNTYLTKLKEFLMMVKNSDDIIVIFTLNQISDNPIWYKEKEGEEVFNLLIELLRTGKAVISTYNDYDVITYFKNRALSAFKRVCDDNDDDLMYLSSVIEELEGIKGIPVNNDGVIKYHDTMKKSMHDALFGIEKSCTIEDNIVTWNKNIKNGKCSFDKYIEKNSKKVSNKNVYGYFNGLNVYLDIPIQKDRNSFLENLSYCDEKNNSRTASLKQKEKKLKKRKVFIKRITQINEVARFVPNATFVNDNNIKLHDIIELFTANNELFEKFYNSTIDVKLKKRLKSLKNEKLFIENSKRMFYDIAQAINPNRSNIYLNIHKMINAFLKKTMKYEDSTYRNKSCYRLATAFVSEFIDFCYNYYNCLLCYGMDNEFEFEFIPYHTKDKHFENLSEPIKLGNIFKDKINYKIIDKNNKVRGYFLSFSNATSKAEEINKKEKIARIVDKTNEVIYPLEMED